jgi:hypothetical protein
LLSLCIVTVTQVQSTVCATDILTFSGPKSDTYVGTDFSVCGACGPLTPTLSGPCIC